MTEHTPEPWRIGTPPPNGEQTIGNEKGLMVAVATTGHGVSSKANARRIVACVNACAGMTNEQIDNVCMISGSLLNRFGEQMAYLGQVEKQRDDLLAALKRVSLELGIDGLLPEWEFVGEAIASVKEKQNAAD